MGDGRGVALAPAEGAQGGKLSGRIDDAHPLPAPISCVINNTFHFCSFGSLLMTSSKACACYRPVNWQWDPF